MHLTNPVKSEVLIIYILLMVTRILTTTETEKMTTVDTYPHAKVMTTTMKEDLEEEHIQLDTLYRIWTNIRTARLRIRKQSDTIRKFYSKVMALTSGFVFDWLPKEHLQMFERNIRHLEKHMKVSVMIPLLHSSLELFLAAFEEMLGYDSKDQSAVQNHVYKTRQNIIDWIVNDLKMTLVEVKSGLDAFNLEDDVRTTTEMPTKVPKTSRPDHTFVMIHDWGVIAMYYRFVKEWEKIAQSIFESYCLTVDTTHHCHILLKTATAR